MPSCLFIEKPHTVDINKMCLRVQVVPTSDFKIKRWKREMIP